MKILKILGIIALMVVIAIISIFQKIEKKEHLKQQYSNEEFETGFARLSDEEKEYVRSANVKDRKCPIKLEKSSLIHIEYKPLPQAEFLYVFQMNPDVSLNSDVVTLKKKMISELKDLINQSTKEFMIGKYISYHYIYLSSVGDTLQDFVIRPDDYK